MSQNVEHIIKEIITIDKDAESHKQEMKMFLETKRQELKDTLITMEKEAENNIKIRKKEIMEIKLKETERNIENVRKEKDIELMKLKESYRQGREELIEDILKKLIGDPSEGMSS